MGIEDIQISEELETNAPSIRYSGDEGPKSPQEMERMMMAQLEDAYEQYVMEMLEMEMEPMSLEQFIQQAMAEAQMSGGQPLPNDPTKPVNPWTPKPQGPTLPNRQMAAYGGIMGLDGRKQYGAGSWFQKYIKDPIEMAITGKSYEDLERESQARVDSEPEGYESYFDTLFKGKKGEDSQGRETREGGMGQHILPIIGGAVAGLFTKKNQDGESSAMSPDETALALADLKKSANILDQKQGLAAGLNFLPAVSARKFTPTEMIEAYKTESAANGGRIGFEFGKRVPPVKMPDPMERMLQNMTDEEKAQFKLMMRINAERMPKYKPDPNAIPPVKMPTYPRVDRAEGGLMDLGGMEKDYRAEGGFVPIGAKEKADDVPARLSVNEFVFTADAVRNAGGGDIDKGAEVMENMMKHLEAGGQVSEESQGMGGAREMFETSERLSEVI